MFNFILIIVKNIQRFRNIKYFSVNLHSKLTIVSCNFIIKNGEILRYKDSRYS